MTVKTSHSFGALSSGGRLFGRGALVVSMLVASVGELAADPTIAVSAASEFLGTTFSGHHRLSDDGRFIVFSSPGKFLVPEQRDENSGDDVFLLDRELGSIELISRTDSPIPTTGDAHSSWPAISGDGKTIFFFSGASDLASDLVEIFPFYYLLDRSGGAAVATQGSEIRGVRRSGPAERGEFSPTSLSFRGLDHDGSTLLFVGRVLFPGLVDPNGGQDIFLYDIASATPTLVSRSFVSPTMAANLGSPANDLQTWALSDEGDVVAFVSRASDLVSSDPNGFRTDVFVFDAGSGTVSAVSQSAAGGTGNRLSRWVTMSGDGRYIAFESRATDLLAGFVDGNGPFATDVFLLDRSTGSLTLISASILDPLRGGNRDSNRPWVGHDGLSVAFSSQARDLIPGFVDGNAADEDDVYVFEIATGSVSLVSSTQGGPPNRGANGASQAPRLTGAGVVFDSLATDLVLGSTDGNGPAASDVFHFERTTGVNTLLSHNASSTSAGGNGTSALTAVSAGGPTVLFDSLATDLVAVEGERLANGFYHTSTESLVVAPVARQRDGALLEPSTTAAGPSHRATVSGNGQYVAFISRATNVARGIIGGVRQFGDLQQDQLFLYESMTGATTLVSHAAGEPKRVSSARAIPPVISHDGTYVAFLSWAGDLVDGFEDANGFREDLYLFSRDTGTTTLVSRDAQNPKVGANGRSSGPTLSDDGRFVLWESSADNLVAGFVDGNPATDSSGDVFLFDRLTDTIQLVSAASVGGGLSGSGASFKTGISADGRFTVLVSVADDLLPGFAGQPGLEQLFRWDRLTGEMKLISGRFGSEVLGANGRSLRPVMSADGSMIVFRSLATDLVAGVVSRGQLYSWSSGSNSLRLVSHVANDPTTAGDGQLGVFAVSPDGAFAAFWSSTPNVVDGFIDQNGFGGNIFLYDLASGNASLVDHQVGAPLTGSSGHPQQVPGGVSIRLSDDGRFVVYVSDASDLVAGFIPGTSGSPDIYRFDRVTGVNELISSTFSDPLRGGNEQVIFESISADGHIVAFSGLASDLVFGDQNQKSDVFLAGNGLDADLATSKTDAVDPVGAGDPINYQLTIENLGSGAATGIHVTDSLPAGLTFDTAAGEDWACGAVAGAIGCFLGRPLAAGETAPAITIVASSSEIGVFENVAVVAAGTPDPAPSSNVDGELTTVQPADLLFADGFESGDSMAWSSTVP